MFYTYSFSLPLGTDVYRLADKLLSTGLAHGAIIAGSDKVRIGRQFKADLRLRQHVANLAELEDVFKKQRKLLDWIVSHPSTAIFAARRRLIKVRLWSKKTSAEEQEVDTDKIVQELRDAVSSLDRRMFERTQLVGGLSAIDQAIFSPIYLQGEPFIRLDLETFYTNCDLFDDKEVLPFLLLHRSGVALLSFATVPGSPRSVDQLLTVSGSVDRIFDTTIIPNALLENVRLGANLIESLDEVKTDDDESTGYQVLKWRENVSITDMYHMYSHQVRRLVAGRQIDEYFCYTTLFIGGFGCCGSRRRWLGRHSRELAGLATRNEGYGRLRQGEIDKILSFDRSITEDGSRLYFAGNALIVDWEFDPASMQVSLPDNAGTIAVIENALLQHWQIHSLDGLIAAGDRAGESSARIERELINGLEEYGRSTISWGTAQEIATSILDQLGVPQTYERMTNRLTLLRQMTESRKAQSGDRRNVLAATLGAAAAILFGIPAIRDSLAVIAKLDPNSAMGKTISPIREWARGGSGPVLTTYGVVISLFMVVAIASLFLYRTRREKVRAQRPVGIEWHPYSPSFTFRRPKFRRGIKVDDDRTEARHEEA